MVTHRKPGEEELKHTEIEDNLPVPPCLAVRFDGQISTPYDVILLDHSGTPDTPHLTDSRMATHVLVRVAGVILSWDNHGYQVDRHQVKDIYPCKKTGKMLIYSPSESVSGTIL